MFSYFDDLYLKYMELTDEGYRLEEEIGSKKSSYIFLIILISLGSIGAFVGALLVKNELCRSIFVELCSGSAFFVAITVLLKYAKKNRNKIFYGCCGISIILLFLGNFTEGIAQSFLVEFSIGILMIAILDIILQNLIKAGKIKLYELKKELKKVQKHLP